MQEILKWEKQVPLTFSLMKKAVPAWVQCRLYDELASFKTLQQACAGKPCLVVLYTMKPTSKRRPVQGGHYSLVIRGTRIRYWSSYGFPVEFEIAMSHNENHLKRLIGNAVNAEVAYQAAAGTETCWRWCLLRSNLYKMSESRFAKLFYRLDASVKSPDDLCSLITLGMLGPGYMAQALRSNGNRS